MIERAILGIVAAGILAAATLLHPERVTGDCVEVIGNYACWMGK